MHPKSYTLRNNITDIGFIAQEMEAIVPEVVSGEDAKYKDVEIVSAIEAVEGQDAIEWSDKPSKDNTKDEIKAWMDSNGLSYNSGDTKAGLLAKIPALKQEAIQSVEGREAIYENQLVGGKGMAYGHLVPVLVKAIQELSAKVEALENK